MTTRACRVDLEEAIAQRTAEMVEEEQYPAVKTPSEINEGWCWTLAEDVYLRLGCPDNIRILGAGTMNELHRWLEFNDQHFDAETQKGVNDWKELPYWRDVPALCELDVHEFDVRDFRDTGHSG
jgi:hypothetical protein